jgi:LysR family transcriptional regulator for metE and metH
MLELRHLKAIVALADTGSVTRAAARLHLTQSALSHQLAALENYLDLCLFERQQRPLKLTAAGEILLQVARRVLPELEAARQSIIRLKAAAPTRDLRIAVECHTCYDWLMPAMDHYREAFPEVELDLVAGFHVNPIALLNEYQADVVVVSDATPQSEITYFPLFAYEMVALTARQHRLAVKDYLVAEDFIEETLIPARRTAELTIAILQLVASRRGIAALPRWAVQTYLDRGYVVARSIEEQGLWGKLYAAVRSNEQEIHAAFARLIAETAFSTLAGLQVTDGTDV